VALAGLTVSVFAFEVLMQMNRQPQVLELFALSANGLREGRVWTLVTHLFLHANLLHLLVNLLGLWFLGPEVEILMGRARYLAVYLVSGVCGGLLQTAFAAPNSELVGASGSVCGILLAFTTMNPELPLRALIFFVLPISTKARTLGWGLMVFSLACALLHLLPQIGHLAHLGGAVGGAVLTRMFGLAPRRQPRTAPGVGLRPEELDELLARISREGMESLSRDEQRQLAAFASGKGRRRS
jgi:membrane associated rhomboid family serine protease